MISRDVSGIGSFSFSSSIGPAFYPADDAACRSRLIAGTDAGGIASRRAAGTDAIAPTQQFI